MKKVFFAVLTAVVLLPGVLCASGGEPFAFLKLGMGTRATGMGCAFTSIANDASAAYYNPAGTVNLTGLELMAETYILSFGRSLNYLGIAKPFVLNGVTYAVGFSWINDSAGSDIEARLTNSPTADTQRYSDSSNVFLFNIAVRLSDRVAIGGNFKLLMESLGIPNSITSYKGTGVGFDLGGIIRIIDNLNAGISFTGISTNISWNSSAHSEMLPQVITAGLSYMYSNMFGFTGLSILPSLEVVYSSFSGTKARAGAELSVNDFFFLRAGYNNALALGAGIKLKPSGIFDVKIDYAYMADLIEPGASNHRLGVVIVYVFPETGVGHKGVDVKQPADAGAAQVKPGAEQNKKGTLEDYEW